MVVPFLFIIAGTIGFVMSFLIMIEKLALLQNPLHQTPCDINPIISCGSVMQTWQASVFGFPNPLIGIAGFAVIVTVGMALLSGATFKRWFWLGLEVGTLFVGVVFVHWLFFQSVYVIQSLCPYCMIVWAVTIPIFLYTTLYNLKEGHIPTPKSLRGAIDITQRYHASILFLWYLIITGAILHHFWYYWITL